jgi:NDP-sugar pyrophosphorylase family protein
MLMAAGLGTRLRPFTDLVPKALLPVMGIPCVQYAVDAATLAGVKKIVVNVHHHAAQAKEGFARLDLGGAQLAVSDESPLLLGSAGGIAKALPQFDGEKFFLLNADVLCDVDLQALSNRHDTLRQRHGVSLTLSVFERPAGSGAYREILMDPTSGLIQGLGEVVLGKPYFIGAAVIEPEAFAGISGDAPSEFLPQVLEPAIRNKKAGYFLTRGKWFDVGSPLLWSEAHQELMKLLELGNLSQVWRRRIETINHRIGQNVWISKKARRDFFTADWQGPAYFNDLGDSTARPPREFGPNAVLYGQSSPPSSQKRFENLISYRGLSQSVSGG